MKLAVICAGLLLWAGAAIADEAAVSARLCAGMDREVPTGGRSRADCVDAKRAIEVDFSAHWAQSVGQALYYGRVLEKRPTVVLICAAGAFAVNCQNHAFRAAYAAGDRADVLLCPESAASLDDCRKADL